MSDLKPSVESFLAELKASLSQPDGQATLRRINAERLLRLLADEFIEAHQAERIRILPDNRLTGQTGADFLLQIDDYDVRLLFLDAPDGTPIVEINLLSECLQILEDNPSTAFLVLIWTTDDLRAVPLSMRRTRFLLQNPDRLPSLLAEARPLPETLRALVARQTKIWDFGLDQVPRTTAKSDDMRRLFEEAIGAAIEAECRRSYRQAERKQAATRFPVEEEKRLIFAVLGEALNGAPISDLVSHLTRVMPRGGR